MVAVSAVPTQPDIDPEPFTVPVDRPDDFHLVVVDLFCGGGGFSTGFIAAVIERNRDLIAAETGLDADNVTREYERVQEWLSRNILLVGVNHWDPAVETYRANHPYARALNAKVQSVHPPDAVTVTIDGEEHVLRVDVLIAGPSCIPWSKAKGGMAEDDQQRMSPRHVLHWLELLRPQHFLLENVEGFLKWGPTYWDEDADELKMRKNGEMFEDWVGTLQKYGYSVDWDTFVAADYGDPQSRKRLFVMGRLDYEPVFPGPTHGPEADQPHRPAAEIIDWSDPGRSIWTRDRDHPRVHTTPKYKTMQRIAEGIRRHCADSLAPFADALEDIGRVTESDDVDADAFRDITELRADVVPVEDAAAAAAERDEPFLVSGPAVTRAADSDDERAGLCLPYLLGQHGGAVARDATERPTPTVASAGAISVIDPEPFVLPRNGRQRDHHSNAPSHPSEGPLHTVTANNHDGHLVNPYLVPFFSEGPNQRPRTHAVDEALPTVTASGSDPAVAQPFLISYYNTSTATAVEEPVPTVTTRDRHALIVPEAFPWGLDLRFRMLKPAELKQAQGFPESYELAADAKKRKTKLIGNAVPVHLAKAMSHSLLAPTDRPTLNQYVEGPQPTVETGGGVADDD